MEKRANKKWAPSHTKMEPTVYIVNNSGHDFSDAARYGKIVFLTDGLLQWNKVNLAYRTMIEKLQHSHADDWLVLSGPVSVSSIATAIMAHLHGRVNILIFDVRGNFYRKYTVLLDQLLQNDGGDS